jgi:NAD(P)-dependent dehydrogenase (short-subunit alcohol dehydrogenase family)
MSSIQCNVNQCGYNRGIIPLSKKSFVMKKLENNVSVVTGAGAGMGRAIALLFVAEGSKVVAADISQDRLDSLRKEIEATGAEVTTVLADVAREEDVDNMIRTAVEKYGTLDVLVNNAGIMDNFSPVGELDNATWERVMKVNVDGPFKAMRAAVNIFLARGSGVIVNIISVGGIQSARAGAAYTASKHALAGLTRNTGYMYAKAGIRCNGIAPGAVETSIAETIDFTKITPLVNDRIMSGMVLNPRNGAPSEIAQAALFLASDDSSFVNAEVLVVDGGWSAY